MTQLERFHLPGRMFFAFLFSCLFMIIGRTGAEIYYRYLDTTQYLTIVQPISIDKKTYKPCDSTVLTTKLTAEIDVNVTSLTQLILIGENGEIFRVGRVIQAQTPIRALSEHIISGVIPLPCDLKDGRYFWQGNATYQVRGYDKTISFISDTFNVYQSGVSPSGEQNIQNQIEEQMQ